MNQSSYRNDGISEPGIALNAGLPPSDRWQREPIDEPASRVPHLGHAVLFVALTVLLILFAQLLSLAFAHPAGPAHHAGPALQPKLQLATQAFAYVTALGSCFLVFPLLWGRGFCSGLNWNSAAAGRYASRLVPLGLAIGVAVQSISSLIPMPKSIPMDDFFRTPSDVWLVTLFGTLLAPLFEEVAFRGFLLPAFAIVLDWLGPMLRYLVQFMRARLVSEDPPHHIAFFLEASSAGLYPETGNLFFRSRTAIVAASLLSSALFAKLHSDQIAHAWGGLIVLFMVSLALTAVRVRSKSVACSAIVHASYNLSVFLTLFIATGGYRHLERMAK